MTDSCRMCLKFWAVGVIVCLAAPGQAAAQRREQTLVVSALEKETGRPVEALAARDVLVREDRVTREVLRVSHLDSPMQLAILVDNSTAAEFHVSNLREGLTRFVRALGPAHELSLVTYASRPTLVVSVSKDRGQLEDAVGRLFSVPDAGAYLLDALEETANGFIKRGSRRPVIVVVDVRGAPLSYAYYQRVLDRIIASGAQLHVVQVVEAEQDISQEARDRSIVITEGTRKTGGRLTDLLTSSSLPDALVQLAGELQSQYSVVYGRPESLIPPREVTVSSARPEVEIRGTALKSRE